MENTEGEIEIKEFLKLLKIACHVNDLIRDSKEANSNFIDFDKLASNKIVNDLYGFNKCENTDNIDALLAAMNNSSEKAVADSRRNRRKFSNGLTIKQKVNSTVRPAESGHKTDNHPKLTEKLDYLINEGVLDSILPFVCPAIPNKNQTKGIQKVPSKIKTRENSPRSIVHPKSMPSITCDTEEFSNLYSTKELSNHMLGAESDGCSVVSNKKAIAQRTITPQINLSVENKDQDAEVVIHVCDEIKNSSRDFTCPQKLLVSKMGYFADVTAGQKLEDMDISVHCDIQIFDWLMKWIKKDPDQQESLPQLDAANVVPILVSASFLQMEPLLLDCLSFCHARLSDVVRSSTNLSCLNDSIITRLAAMFTNLELEVIKDKKDRVTPRLWTKLIQSLCEPEPQALRGHYFSLAGLFRCSRCSKCLTQTMSSYISCVPPNSRLNRWGQIVNQHTREVSWDLSSYISSLFKELKSWRKVYWKLWGHCHFLYCCICETHFPVYQMTWCRFHPDVAQFLGPATEGLIAGPSGRYPCCGQQAYRYETLPGPNGCQYREHSVVIENDRDRAILTLLQIAAEGGNLFENPPIKLQEDVSKYPTEPRWFGLCLMPTKCRPGLLPVLSSEEHHSKLSRKLRFGGSNFTESSSESDISDAVETTRKVPSQNFSVSSDGCESENNSPRGVQRPRKRRQTDFSGRYWSGELSARSNQDHQREFEERVMKQVTTAVGKKTGSDTNTAQRNTTNCGTYIRLESEWKEQVKQKHSLKLKFK